MQNVNRLLENSHRSDLFGYNMASFGRYDWKRETQYPDTRPGRSMPEAQWDAPRPGMSGIFVYGHHAKIDDVLTLTLTVDGQPQEPLYMTRHRWTPAWMDTIYRSPIDAAYYPYCGTAVLRERKAILRSDVYIAHVTLSNGKREAARMALSPQCPFVPLEGEPGLYRAVIETETAAGGTHTVQGYAAILFSGGTGHFEATVEPLFEAHLRYAMAIAPTPGEARSKALAALVEDDPFGANESAFNAWFDRYVPRLEIENGDMLKLYYYRWFVVYHGIHDPARVIPTHEISRPSIYESQIGGWYGGPVGLPVPWQIKEARWMREPDVLHAHLDNWCEGKRLYQQYIQFVPWAAWQAYLLHPDKAWLSAHYDSFRRYVTDRFDLDHPVPTITHGSWGTGAEYQPSFYQHTPGKPWDWRYDVEGHNAEGFPMAQLWRLDDLCYHILSMRGCAHMAHELGLAEDEARFLHAAEVLRQHILARHWDDHQQFFFDRDVAADALCDQAACYDGFAPFMDGIAGRAYHAAFCRLTEQGWFASDFGVPSAARNCPMFWYDNCIAGPTESSVAHPHDYGCSWNGPVWPYANSIVAAGMGDAACADPALQEDWLRFFRTWSEVHFSGGDRSTPVVCEHYRCDDGATWSIANDYFHSSWLDPFISYYLGIRVGDGQVIFSPFTKEAFLISGVQIAGQEYTFEQRLVNGRVQRFITPAKEAHP